LLDQRREAQRGRQVEQASARLAVGEMDLGHRLAAEAAEQAHGPAAARQHADGAKLAAARLEAKPAFSGHDDA
jgi:hypothetical protein